MGNLQTCCGRRSKKISKQYEEEAEAYKKIEEEEKKESKECNFDNGITPSQIDLLLNRDEWIRRFQELKYRIAFFDALYEDIARAALVGWDELREQASILKKSIQNFKIPKERFWDIKSPEVDSTTGEIYPDDASSGFTPAECFGDGNSLYRAISAQIFGCEDHHLEIRLRVALELIDNMEDYLYGDKLQKMSSHHVDNLVESAIQMSVIGQETDIEQAMQDILFQTLVPGTKSSILHIYAAANATHRHIESIYPNVTNTASNRDMLHQTIRSLTPHTDKPLHIMWTHTLNTYLDATWTPNHFVPCLKFDSDTELEMDSDSYTSSESWFYLYNYTDIFNRI